MDNMSQLLTIGEGDFFVSCLLFLSPEDLKACRLVNKTWNDLIKERVWGKKRARKRLEEKLLIRWKTINPDTVQLGTVPLGVLIIFCNNNHVFCGVQGGKVKVYNLTDGQWVRDLESGEEDLGVVRICGGESIVAAWLGLGVVTVWSSKEEMGRLHSFDVHNHDGLEDGWVGDIKVTGNKAVLLLRDDTSSTNQLVVLQEGEHNWENKILEPFSMPLWGKLAAEGDWLAVAGGDESGPDVFKVKLWKEDLFRQDIELPGVSAGDARDVVLDSPFLVVGGTTGSSWFGEGEETGWIKVFQLAADNLMEDLNTAASLAKTVQFPGFFVTKLLCTQLVWGCMMVAQDHLESSLDLSEKTAFLDAATPPEQTQRNRIHLRTRYYNLVDMNTTSLVFIQRAIGQENQLQDYVCKKDFWMSNAIA